MTAKRKTASAFDATEGPGLARLARNAEATREATLVDQKRARGEAKANGREARGSGLWLKAWVGQPLAIDRPPKRICSPALMKALGFFRPGWTR
jgi:hypothetical protein